MVRMVVDSILPHAEFGPNDHRKDAPPFIHALNSDTHTLRFQYEYTQKQCVGVAIEGRDIWYVGLIFIISSSPLTQSDSKFVEKTCKTQTENNSLKYSIRFAR